MRALTHQYPPLMGTFGVNDCRNEVLAREGIDTLFLGNLCQAALEGRNEVLAREGIDTVDVITYDSW